MKRRITLVLLMCPLFFAADTNDPVKPVSSATPQQQLGGDLFQILNSNYESGAADRFEMYSGEGPFPRVENEAILVSSCTRADRRDDDQD